MPDLDRIERWIWLSVAKALRDAPSLLGVTVFYPGSREAAPLGAEEWVNLWPLSINRDRRPRGTWGGVVLFQVTCSSKFLEVRADVDGSAVWKLASRVRAALETADVPIRTLGVGEPSTQIVGTLSVHEGDMTYINQRAGQGNFAVSAADQDLAHQVAVTFRGHALAVET